MDTNDWDALIARAASALQDGHCERAILLYDDLIARKSDYAEGYYKRANASYRLARWEAALLDYGRAIMLNPGYANAFCNRGAVLERLSRWDEALSSYERAVELNPSDFLTCYNRGSVLRELGRLSESLASYDQAIALKSDYSEAYINRGNVLQEMRRDEAAVESYDKAIQLKPVHAEAFHGRGTSYINLGLFDAAIASFDRASALKPDYKFILGMRRYTQMKICDWRGLETDLERLAQGLRAHAAVCSPFPVLALVDSPALQHLAAQIWVREQCPPDDSLGRFPARFGADKSQGRKIRIGYFSADFRNHPVAMLTAELFESHDRSRFDITAFALGPQANDAMRTRLERAFDQFIDVGQQSDSEIALLARKLGIDIAVDLGGFTEHCRTKIFALRAAPLQINYLGYPGTMGAHYMDYLIGDETVIPEVHRPHYAEKIVYLPHSYLPYDSNRAISDRQFTRQELGLPPVGFVFCCFNNNYKISPATFDGWMRILGRVEGSVVWLSHYHPTATGNLRQEASRRNISPDRLVFADRLPSLAEHLARHRAAELFLDTRPYNAHATAIDALWAGLPVLTHVGEGFAGRVGASLLEAIELPELIAATAEEYEDLAVELARNPQRLAQIRQKLALNRLQAALFDARSFTRDLEAAYTEIHRRYEANLPPTHIRVGS